jgi:hypothetical protein
MSKAFCDEVEKKKAAKYNYRFPSNGVKAVLLKYLEKITTEGLMSDTVMYLCGKKKYLNKSQKMFAKQIIDCIVQRDKEGIISEPGDKTGLDDLLMCGSNVDLDCDIKINMLEFLTK